MQTVLKHKKHRKVGDRTAPLKYASYKKMNIYREENDDDVVKTGASMHVKSYFIFTYTIHLCWQYI